MSLKHNYRYYCIEEGGQIFEDILVGDPAPTQCKNNASHTIEDVVIFKRGAYSSSEVKVSSTDTGNKFLSEALSNNGNVNFTIENPGGNETLKADVENNTALWNANKILDVPINISTHINGGTLIYESDNNEYVSKKFFNEDDTFIIHDDFISSDISTNWIQCVIGSGSSVSVIDGVGGIIRLRSGTTNGDSATLAMTKKHLLTTLNSFLKIRFKLGSITFSNTRIGYTDDNNNHIEFFYEVLGGANNWQCRCVKNGVDTTLTTTVVADLNWHIFKIDISPSLVVFYIDGVIVGNINFNVPEVLMKIQLKQESNSMFERNTLCDFVKFCGDRQGNSPGSSASSGGCIIL